MAGLALIDLDGTLTTEKSFWPAMHDAAGTRRPAEHNRDLYHSGAIDYHEYARLDAALLVGVPHRHIAELVTPQRFRAGVQEFFQAIHAKNYRPVILSSGIQFLAAYAATTLSTRPIETHCNTLRFDKNDRCSGTIDIAVDDTSKGAAASRIIDAHRPSRIFAIGDSIADYPLFELADSSISIGPALSGLTTANLNNHSNLPNTATLHAAIALIPESDSPVQRLSEQDPTPRGLSE